MWSWDETLYAGSAEYYARGRFDYPQELADALRDELGLDGTGRLLDVGCGPGPLTLLLAPLFDRVVGVDADADMLAVARRRAQTEGCRASSSCTFAPKSSLRGSAPSGSRASRSRSTGWTVHSSRRR
jgi:cyclopropane fatty-acyl-phospholipid synthase-like methyltransferase